MKITQIIYGMATSLPVINRLLDKGTGGTDSARYCYSVWLRHLVMAKKNGLNPYPNTIAELGPGDSLGIGLAALISGCEKYFAFDVIEYASIDRNIKIFDEIVTLFKNRTPIPGRDEFPEVKPYLDKYDFPSDIFDENVLGKALEKSRLDKVRASIHDLMNKDSLIKYKAPWHGSDVLEKESVDMIYSQAVLEHIDDLKGAYKAMRLWLKPTGYMSHQIDFRCHETDYKWNGHWTYSDFIWRLIRGGRAYLINRYPHSKHIEFINQEGFGIVYDNTIKSESCVTLNDLSPRFKYMASDDLVTSGAFIQAVKNVEASP